MSCVRFSSLGTLLTLAGLLYAQELTIGRLRYSGGGDWYSNPSSLANLLAAFRRDTGARVALREKVVSLQDGSYRTVPIIYFTGHGKLEFSEKERENLRAYLREGGFLFADDNFGMDPYIRKELNQLFPDSPLKEIPCSHVIFRTVHDMPGCLPKIHEHYGGPPQAYGIFLNGRLVVFYGYNTDLGDGWEDIDVHNTPPHKHELALKMGVNVLYYALTAGLVGK
ncbi:MAG: DUF4159 domain-containing protein [Leptospiraceae bacterium]|nr:DUF4159 domain-containing protein [Leptospiraceae bacterium]MDW8305711.1 DUF4159 domain-containing protein [Leptospiraceae bacterium]